MTTRGRRKTDLLQLVTGARVTCQHATSLSEKRNVKPVTHVLEEGSASIGAHVMVEAAILHAERAAGPHI